MNRIILFLILLSTSIFAQSTYTIGKTEYYSGQYYSTTGKPMVKRSEANKMEFLRSKGYNAVPYGYEVDHIIPLSQGGSDDPSNMQLLTIEAHDRKTAMERGNSSNSTYHSYPDYKSSSTNSYNTYSTPSSTGKTIYTGPNGGQYYINSNGNKTYINSGSNSSNNYSNPPAFNYSAPKTVYTGSRGGQYYINSNGNKTYIKK